MVDIFGIPNFEYIGSIGGIIIIFLIFWFIIKRSSGRMGLERKEIQEDKELVA